MRKSIGDGAGQRPALTWSHSSSGHAPLLPGFPYKIPYIVRSFAAKSFAATVELLVHNQTCMTVERITGDELLRMAQPRATLAARANLMRRSDNRRGGLERARRLSPARRREIALAASIEATKKRNGQVTLRALTQAYVSRVKSEDPQLGRFIELALQAPPRYVDAQLLCLPLILAPDELQLAKAALEEVQVYE